MKKLFKLFALTAMVAIGFTACTKSELTQAGNSNGKSVTINASITEPATRVAFKEEDSKLNMYWSDAANKDKFSLHYDGAASSTYVFTKSEATTDAQITSFTCASAPSISEGTKVYAVYPGSSTITSNITIVPFSLLDQPGTEPTTTSTTANVGDFNFMSAHALVPASGLADAHFHFEHKVALVKMTLTFPADVIGPVSNISINASNMHNKGTFRLPLNQWYFTDEQLGSVSTKSDATFALNAEKRVTVWLAVFPEALTDVKITAVANGDNYSVALPNQTLMGSKVYTVNRTMIKNSFKSIYTLNDYYRWDAKKPVLFGSETEAQTGTSANASCKNSPTPAQFVAYIKATVYWDDSDFPVGRKTYSAPKLDGTSFIDDLHTGLWIKKKDLIGAAFDAASSPLFSTDDDGNEGYFVKLSSLQEDIITNIRSSGDYFFLPAAGYYSNSNSRFLQAGLIGFYWSNTGTTLPSNSYCLVFNQSSAQILAYSSINGCLPIVAE